MALHKSSPKCPLSVQEPILHKKSVLEIFVDDSTGQGFTPANALHIKHEKQRASTLRRRLLAQEIWRRSMLRAAAEPASRIG